jgi:hypothetical protein
MTLNRKLPALAIVSMLGAGAFAASSAMQAAGARQETGPVYSIEGAWYGMTYFPGTIIPLTPTFDTFTSNARRSGVEGSFLCTIPAEIAVLPVGSFTASAHGSWVRIATNTYAYTSMRAITSGATVVGWAKFFGTVTAISENELTGTINSQLYDPNLTPISGVSTGTLERRRVEIVFEQ